MSWAFKEDMEKKKTPKSKSKQNPSSSVYFLVRNWKRNGQRRKTGVKGVKKPK